MLRRAICRAMQAGGSPDLFWYVYISGFGLPIVLYSIDCVFSNLKLDLNNKSGVNNARFEKKDK